jgi:hypothetical protein
MLNDLISEKFFSTPLMPFKIEGRTAREVFKNAGHFRSPLSPIDGPLVSVIMSAYNPDVELMKVSLESIAAQTWRNIEVFIVDDASDEQMRTAIEELAASSNNVVLLRMDVNSGPYVGRSLAIQQAKGEFIAIQDADDWSHPQRFGAQVDFLLRTPQARAVTTEHIRINRAGHVSLEGEFRAFGYGPMTSMFRADVFEQVGDFAAIRSRGDVEMRERIAGYYGHQANATLPLPMALCFADSATLSHSTTARMAEHLQLFRTNISRRPAMNSLLRDGIPLSAAHQVPVPVRLRAPQYGRS